MAGERSALAPLVERYHGPLLGYLFRLTNGNRALAEDLVQETFLRLLQQHSYRSNRSFKPWLYAIATNLARDYFRSAIARRTTSLEDQTLPDVADPHVGPEEVTQANDQTQAITRAMEQIGQEHQIVLILRFYGGLSLKEISESLDIPLGTVKSRLSNGTHRLRDLLSSLKMRNSNHG
jgi:RNA polymerase sigma-70 factor (ECF subfamily)